MKAALLLAAALAPLVSLAQDSAPPPAEPAIAAPAPAPAPAPVASVPPPAVDPGAAVAAPPAPPAVPTAPPPTAAPPPKPSKDGGYFGFAFGTGTGEIYSGSTTVDLRDVGPDPRTLAIMGRFGHRTGDFIFGLQANLVRTQWSSGGSTAAMNVMGLDLVSTLVIADDIFLRVGVGPASVSFEGSGSTSDSYTGAEVILGMGFHMSGMTVGIDMLLQTYSDPNAPFDGSRYLLATIGFGSF